MDDQVDYEMAKAITTGLILKQIEGWEPGVYDHCTDTGAQRMCMVEQLYAEAMGWVGEGDI